MFCLQIKSGIDIKQGLVEQSVIQQRHASERPRQFFLMLDHFLSLVELVCLIFIEKLAVDMIFLKIGYSARVKHVLDSPDLLLLGQDILFFHRNCLIEPPEVFFKRTDMDDIT